MVVWRLAFTTVFLGRVRVVSLSFSLSAFTSRFLHASALSKIGNFMTNLAALSFLIPTGHAILHIGLMMAAANVVGSIVGVRTALKYGSGFVRIIFLILVSILICRLGYQILSRAKIVLKV